MATRFYFEQVLTATAPAISASWLGTSVVRARMRTAKHKAARSAAPILNIATETGAVVVNVIHVQLISLPLAAQTITGTVKGYALFSESVLTQDCRTQCEIRILAPDGTVRGTLLAANTDALSSEFTTTATNRRIPLLAAGNTLTSVSAQAGDFLVVEIGYRTHTASAAAYSTSLQWHDDPTTGDLPEDETTTDTTLAPWLEFSQTLIINDQFDFFHETPLTPLDLKAPLSAVNPSSVSVSADSLLEFSSPALPYNLANRLDQQFTDSTEPVYQLPRTLGEITAVFFYDSFTSYPAQQAAIPPVRAVSDPSFNATQISLLATFADPPLPYTFVDLAGRDIAGTLPLIPVPVIVAPTVVNVLPSDGTITVGEVVSFDVFDAAGLVACVVLAKLPEITRYEVVYDGAVFGYQYEGSTVTPILNALHFECVRVGGWPVGVTFKTIAVNTGALVG